MKTKTINVYDYEELNQEAKERALNNYREHNQMEFLKEDLINLLEEKLEENKIISGADLKIYYSLSNCQGDGLGFEGFFNWKNYNIKIIHSGRYYHKYSYDIFIYEFDEFNGEKDANEKVYQEFKEIYFKICDQLEKEGYKLIEFENSEENIKDFFNSNEITFRSNGLIENL